MVQVARVGCCARTRLFDGTKLGAGGLRDLDERGGVVDTRATVPHFNGSVITLSRWCGYIRRDCAVPRTAVFSTISSFRFSQGWELKDGSKLHRCMRGRFHLRWAGFRIETDVSRYGEGDASVWAQDLGYRLLKRSISLARP